MQQDVHATPMAGVGAAQPADKAPAPRPAERAASERRTAGGAARLFNIRGHLGLGGLPGSSRSPPRQRSAATAAVEPEQAQASRQPVVTRLGRPPGLTPATATAEEGRLSSAQAQEQAFPGSLPGFGATGRPASAGAARAGGGFGLPFGRASPPAAASAGPGLPASSPSLAAQPAPSASFGLARAGNAQPFGSYLPASSPLPLPAAVQPGSQPAAGKGLQFGRPAQPPAAAERAAPESDAAAKQRRSQRFGASLHARPGEAAAPATSAGQGGPSASFSFLFPPASAESAVPNLGAFGHPALPAPAAFPSPARRATDEEDGMAGGAMDDDGEPGSPAPDPLKVPHSFASPGLLLR